MSRTAVILAAGFGTRMKSALPKTLHKIAGRSMLRHLLASCEQVFDRIVVVIGPDMEAVRREAAPHVCVVQQERRGTAHAALISRILDLLANKQPRSASADPARLHTPLSDSESRVLRYLPTNLSAPEIARELSLSVNTVRTHTRHIYEKLGAHSRTEAVELARALGLVAPSASRR